MNGKKAKAARRAAKILCQAVDNKQGQVVSNERYTYQRMKATIKQPEVRQNMYS